MKLGNAGIDRAIAGGESGLQARPFPGRGWSAFIARGLQRIPPQAMNRPLNRISLQRASADSMTTPYSLYPYSFLLTASMLLAESKFDSDIFLHQIRARYIELTDYGRNVRCTGRAALLKGNDKRLSRGQLVNLAARFRRFCRRIGFAGIAYSRDVHSLPYAGGIFIVPMCDDFRARMIAILFPIAAAGREVCLSAK